MILWITGNSGAGKTTLAYKLKRNNTIVLDGDEVRGCLNDDLDLSNDGRIKSNIRIAKLAKNLEQQGFDVVVSTICPFEDLRRKVKDITNCMFIYLPMPDDTQRDGYPFEKPLNPEMILRR